MSQFIDSALVTVESGKGGNGASSFHREKHVPRGGPNGADGGRGGSVVLVADRGVRTLYDFKLKDHYKAPDGTDAHGNKNGRDAEDLVIRLPVGTIVSDSEGSVLGDLDSDGARLKVAKGGRGGRGNLHFTTSVRQAPTIAERGEPSETAVLKLELKLLADVGLIGLPNAGKSTLISACSAARPKIGAYPFTTITPNLGVVSIGDQTFVMADMPGLIEGASEGVGLGHQFLKHVERTRVLVHVVDLFPIDDSDPLANFNTVENELRLYSPEMADRPRVLALNKTDLASPDQAQTAAAPFEALGLPCFLVSAATDQGLQPLLFHLAGLLAKLEAEDNRVVVRPKMVEEQEEEPWTVELEDECYVLKGKRLVRMVEMTNLSNNEAVRYLHRRLQRMGVIDKLREMGAEDGDSVRVGDWEFAFTE